MVTNIIGKGSQHNGRMGMKYSAGNGDGMGWLGCVGKVLSGPRKLHPERLAQQAYHDATLAQ
eukprot:2612438-Karenia_brevis.AAC.1